MGRYAPTTAHKTFLCSLRWFRLSIKDSLLSTQRPGGHALQNPELKVASTFMLVLPHRPLQLRRRLLEQQSGVS